MILSVKPIEPKQVVRRNEMKYTLRQLEIFLAVARHQNISRAAKSLHMSQSAASEALLNLEHTFDVTLFDRVSNKLALNPVGNTLRKEAESLLRQCRAFEEALEYITGHPDVWVTTGREIAEYYIEHHYQAAVDSIAALGKE